MDASAEALTLKYMYMFLRKKTLVLKEKYFLVFKVFQFSTDTLVKMLPTIFAYPFVSDYSKFFFILKKKLYFLAAGGGRSIGFQEPSGPEDSRHPLWSSVVAMGPRPWKLSNPPLLGIIESQIVWVAHLK